MSRVMEAVEAAVVALATVIAVLGGLTAICFVELVALAALVDAVGGIKPSMTAGVATFAVFIGAQLAVYAWMRVTMRRGAGERARSNALPADPPRRHPE